MSCYEDGDSRAKRTLDGLFIIVICRMGPWPSGGVSGRVMISISNTSQNAYHSIDVVNGIVLSPMFNFDQGVCSFPANP